MVKIESTAIQFEWLRIEHKLHLEALKLGIEIQKNYYVTQSEYSLINYTEQFYSFFLI